MKKTSYFESKDNNTGEIVYLEYNKNGYKVSPKTKKSDAIEVNKIIFVSPTLTEKLLKKKINSKISKLLLELNTFYDEEDTGDSETIRIRNQFLEAQKLKENLINKYKEFLNENYVDLTIKKIQIIIDGYNSRMNAILEQKKKQMLMEIMARNTYIEE